MAIGERRPKSLGSLVDLGLATDGFVDFLAGVSSTGVVVMGDMGRLRFLILFVGRSSKCVVGGTSWTTLSSGFIAYESDDRSELPPKDGARLSDLEVGEVAKDLACSVLCTRGLLG